MPSSAAPPLADARARLSCSGARLGICRWHGRMNSDADQSSASLEIARGLLDRQAARRVMATRRARARRCSGRVRACATTCATRSGRTAAARCWRARSPSAKTNHPALKDVRPSNGDGVYLDGVPASIETHGVAAVTAAIEALLAALIDILGRLIGEDMATRLIDHDASTVANRRWGASAMTRSSTHRHPQHRNGRARPRRGPRRRSL